MKDEVEQISEGNQVTPNLLVYVNQVDALLVLRAVACCMVVVQHCGPPRSSIFYKGLDLSWLLFGSDFVGVWIFFALSGYLMGKAFYTDRYQVTPAGVLNFWRNRAIRIGPLYYFALLILCLFAYPEILKLENWGFLVRLLTFTYSPHLPIRFNGSFWSLSTEVQFYLIFPFIYALFRPHLYKKLNVLIAFLLVILGVFVVKAVFILNLGDLISKDMFYVFKYWYTPLVNNLDVFLIGFLVNPLIRFRGKQIPSLRLKTLAIFLVFLLFLYTAYHLYHNELWSLPNRPGGMRTSTMLFLLQPITALVTAFFIYAFDSSDSHNQPHVRNQKLSFSAILGNPWRGLEILGNLSYGIYIWHYHFIGTVTIIGPWSTIPLENFYYRCVITLVFSSLLSAVTYYLVERPAAQWKVYSKSLC